MSKVLFLGQDRLISGTNPVAVGVGIPERVCLCLRSKHYGHYYPTMKVIQSLRGVMARLPDLLAGSQALVLWPGYRDAEHGTSIADYQLMLDLILYETEQNDVPVVLLTLPPSKSGRLGVTQQDFDAKCDEINVLLLNAAQTHSRVTTIDVRDWDIDEVQSRFVLTQKLQERIAQEVTTALIGDTNHE